MDTASAVVRGVLNRGKPSRVFDWDKAASIIAGQPDFTYEAGLSTDMEYTAGTIWRDGKPVYDEYTFLGSTWAIPVLSVGGEETPCWKYAADTPGWNCHTKWPDSALDIIGIPSSEREEEKETDGD